MTGLTDNCEREKLSRREFESIMHPWDCRSYEHDVGIDLIVQPFDEKQRSPQNNSLMLFEKRFLVQLKSTKNETEKVNSDTAKISIDVKHLLDWKRQCDPVMIARYYIQEGCFYYSWIDQVEIKKEQKYQTIYLDKKLTKSNKNETKDNILIHLSPLLMKHSYIPNVKEPSQGICKIQFDNIRDIQQVLDVLNDDFENQAKRRLLIENNIYTLKITLAKDPNDIKSRYALAICYIWSKNYEEAKRELGVLIHLHDLIEAKIIFSILTKGKADILDGLNRFKFVYYLKWKQETPPGTGIKAQIMLDGDRTYTLTEYDEAGVILPVQEFKMFEVAFKFESDGNNTPILYNEGICLMKGLLDRNQKLLYEFGESVYVIKIGSSGFSVGKVKPFLLS